MDRSLMKKRAKELLRNRRWMCVAVCALPLAIQSLSGSSGVPSSFSEESVSSIPFEYSDWLYDFTISAIIFALIFNLAFTFAVSAFATNQLTIGGCRYFLKYRRNNPVDFTEIFRSYKDKTFLNIAKVTIVRDIYVALFSIIFIVPGIIKALEYWAVDYILSVRPDIDRQEAFDLSDRLTDGHKGELFMLELSFLGWHILSLCTFSVVGVLYAYPYMRLTYAEYFSYLRYEAIRKGIISPYDIPDYEDYVPVSPYYPYCPPEPYYNPEQTGFSYQTTPPQQPIYTEFQPSVKTNFVSEQPIEPFDEPGNATQEIPPEQ